LLQETAKDPYSFQFLALREKYVEEELEQGFIEHIQKFLLALAQGFAFIGRSYSLEVSGKDYYLLTLRPEELKKLF
jgi:predicted nuclease of restriction endonuclease-like (RecB) superfamily